MKWLSTLRNLFKDDHIAVHPDPRQNLER